MGRTAVHTVDSLLDAASALFAAGGVAAVTMTAVAESAGAPSGSVYHRFADRSALLAQLWLRTAERFEAGFRAQLGDAPGAAAAVAAAVWGVEWCRAHPHDASLLNAGRRSLAPDTWPTAVVAAQAKHDRALARELAAITRAVAAAANRPRDEVAFALFDLPLAVVRRHVNAARPIPASASDEVRRIATRLLTG